MSNHLLNLPLAKSSLRPEVDKTSDCLAFPGIQQGILPKNTWQGLPEKADNKLGVSYSWNFSPNSYFPPFPLFLNIIGIWNSLLFKEMQYLAFRVLLPYTASLLFVLPPPSHWYRRQVAFQLCIYSTKLLFHCACSVKKKEAISSHT